MPLEITVPSLGQSVPEASVGRWLKNVGDPVAADEAVVELETDKINVEVTAFRGGTLARIDRRPGEVVAVGSVLGLIAVEGEDATEVAASGPSAPAAPDQQAKSAAAPEPAAPPEPVVAPPQAAATEAVIPEGAKTSPAVRKLALEHKLDLNQVTGSGRGGRVTKDDVLAYVASGAAASVAPAAPAPVPASAPSLARDYAADEPIERVPMTPIRKTIAHRMAESRQTAAHVTTVDECDFGALVELRARIKEAFATEHGFKLTYMPFIMKAAIAALKEFPQVNGSIDGQDIVYHRYYHIGVAVHTEPGLVVPVVKHADRQSVVEIAGAIDDLATRARERKLEMSDIQGATFTLSNAGGFGALLSTPIISQPESAVLGIHKIQERPTAVDGKVVIRPMMWFGLSYDHRLVDGTPAVQFLRRVCVLLEDPQRLLLEA
jgi:2-oxoglutarate dehydrogenase E2 component (dihydrolipoamide succinyltransferase)